MPDGAFKSVGGCAFGGASLLGLCSGMTGIDDFDQILKGAKKGKVGKINKTLSDLAKPH